MINFFLADVDYFFTGAGATYLLFEGNNDEVYNVFGFIVAAVAQSVDFKPEETEKNIGSTRQVHIPPGDKPETFM